MRVNTKNSDWEVKYKVLQSQHSKLQRKYALLKFQTNKQTNTIPSMNYPNFLSKEDRLEVYKLKKKLYDKYIAQATIKEEKNVASN